MSDFDDSMEKLNAIQEEVSQKRMQLMLDIREKDPGTEAFLRAFKDDKELESRVVWIELDGVVRLKWGRVL